jgi:hypothetical protein
MSRITRADREGAERYIQLVAGTPPDDRAHVELEAFARLSTRELDALVADLVEREQGAPLPPPAERGGPGAVRRFVRGELGFAAALLACFALVAVLVVGAAAVSNTGVAVTTGPPGQSAGTSGTGHSATSTSVRPSTITNDYGSAW